MAKTIIALSDLEGRLDFLLNTLNDVECPLTYNNQEECIDIPDDYMLVFLGDMFDHGPDDKKLSRIFINTVNRYANNGGESEKIILIRGNREINKERFLSELNDKNILARMKYNDTPNWAHDQLTFFEYIKNFDEGIPSGSKDADGNDNMLKLTYLKWMLTNTMGCGGKGKFKPTFEYHRDALSLEFGRQVTDLEVMQHGFIDSITLKNGMYRQILENSRLGFRFNDTLFIHGGLTAKSLKVGDIDYRNGSLDEWLVAMDDIHAARFAEIVNGQVDAELPPICNGNVLDSLSHGMKPHGIKVLQNLIINSDFTVEQKQKIQQTIDRDGESSTIAVFTKRDEVTGKFVPYVAPEVLKFLHNNGIKNVILGHHAFGNSAMGHAFVMDGISFVYVDITWTSDQKNAMCYAKITCNDNDLEHESSVAVRAYLPTLKRAITIDQISEPVEFGQNDFGFEPGVYTKVFTPARDALYLTRQDKKGNVAIIEAVPAEVQEQINSFTI